MKKVSEVGQMYTTNDFYPFTYVLASKEARNMKGPSVLDILSQATYV